MYTNRVIEEGSRLKQLQTALTEVQRFVKTEQQRQARRHTYAALQDRMDEFWTLDNCTIHQTLSAPLGCLRFVAKDGKIIGVIPT